MSAGFWVQAFSVGRHGVSLQTVNEDDWSASHALALAILQWGPSMSRSPRLRAPSASAFATLALAVLVSTASAEEAADEYAVGKQEYLTACAACHGDAADGKGPIAAMFRTPVPDLTGVAQRNEGRFPFLKVLQIIDGRSVVRAHGDPMPVFGGRFRAEAEDRGAIYGSEAIARARVLELVLFLESIQD